MPQEHRLILKNIDQPGYTPDIECYLKHGGYEVLKKALAIQPKDLADGKKQSGPEQIRDDVKLSGLRGRGGAGFSAGLKWSFVDRRSGKPIYLICNADESEPGTFKDRQIIHKDPHQLIEGMAISCYANDVKLAYIYIRGEMPEGARILNKAIAEAKAKGFLGKNICGSGYDLEIHVHRGAGAYICGEETGLIESLEGKRPYPRIKPPYFPAILGLWTGPTNVNNVETYADEWAATISDPEKLKRFVSFVNAPDVPEPTITFVDERGQIRPAQPGEGGEPRVIAGPTLRVGAV